ncbi:ABC transporter ATP-binding protein [Anaplasma capra]|uniref:ABC transporter ATP-binding protein n=1 Tax=Anaplasma capra TaxID=1562740 RepID=UPI0021D57A3F|nr:ABC transporter ATP-binding protein [Anaplasma capra]MCU7611249.1 ABC transporter ATP-binding protein [Anaplasma capra]MCU7612621.1 ABC transporter ATP-binding protein [Anaplasma capra]
MATVLEILNVSKCYGKDNQACVLSNVNLKIKRGEFVAIIGHSGSGKSTLLHIASLLEIPTSGTVVVNGIVCTSVGDRTRTLVRRRSMGFVYQFHHLLQELSVLENVMLPQRILGVGTKSAAATAMAILEEVGLRDKAECRISDLSGGERQRVAVARGIANSPAIILADEPTGSLDPQMSETVFSVLHKHIKAKNLAGLTATHDHGLAKKSDRVFMLDNGVLTEL